MVVTAGRAMYLYPIYVTPPPQDSTGIMVGLNASLTGQIVTYAEQIERVNRYLLSSVAAGQHEKPPAFANPAIFLCSVFTLFAGVARQTAQWCV